MASRTIALRWPVPMTRSSGPLHTVRAKTLSSDFSQAQVKPQSSSPNQSQWSTPVLQVRDRLLLMPVIGGVDAERARGLAEQLLPAIRAFRAKVVVIDVAGVPAMEAVVANHLVR